MHRIYPELKQSYDSWSAKLAGPECVHQYSVSLDIVLRSHYLLCDHFIREGEKIATAGPRDGNLLGSALSRQHVGFGPKLKWTQPQELIATLFYGLVKNHPFHDGNKRTALLVALYQIQSNGRVPDASHSEFEQLVVRTAKNTLNEYKSFPRFAKHFPDETDARVHFLANFFRHKTRKSDSRYYVITYNELAALLPTFGFRLDNPSNNYIDVIKDEELASGLFGLGRKKTVPRKIAQIGYPGGTREVGKGAINTVRRKCGLTAENGIDSQVFYRNVDPLINLIAKYQGPLKRLKDK